MAANEKQLEKVTLTLTNKMAGSRGPPVGPPGRRATKVSIKWQETSISCLRQTSQVNTQTYALRCWPNAHPVTPCIPCFHGDWFQSHKLGRKLRNGREEDKQFDPTPPLRWDVSCISWAFGSVSDNCETYTHTQTHTLYIYLSLWQYQSIHSPFSVSAKGICDLAD